MSCDIFMQITVLPKDIPKVEKLFDRGEQLDREGPLVTLQYQELGWSTEDKLKELANGGTLFEAWLEGPESKSVAFGFKGKLMEIYTDNDAEFYVTTDDTGRVNRHQLGVLRGKLRFLKQLRKAMNPKGKKCTTG